MATTHRSDGPMAEGLDKRMTRIGLLVREQHFILRELDVAAAYQTESYGTRAEAIKLLKEVQRKLDEALAFELKQREG